MSNPPYQHNQQFVPPKEQFNPAQQHMRGPSGGQPMGGQSNLQGPPGSMQLQQQSKGFGAPPTSQPRLGPTPGGMNIRPPPSSMGNVPPMGGSGSAFTGGDPPASSGPPVYSPGRFSGPHPMGPQVGAPPGGPPVPGGMGGPPSTGAPPRGIYAPPGPGGVVFSPRGPPPQGPPPCPPGPSSGVPPGNAARPPGTFVMGRGPPRFGGINEPPTTQLGQMSMGAPPTSGRPIEQPPNGHFQQAETHGHSGYDQQRPGGYAQQHPGGYGQQQQMQQQPVLSQAMMAAQCEKRFIRVTTNCIPHSQELGAKAHIPIGLVIRPMAPDENGEDNTQVVNFSTNGVIRCNRCRTYINPFVQWVDNGRRWRCNLCGTANDVPSSYFCHLGADGQRQDTDQRPELSSGSVEIVAPAEYMMRPPQPPAYMFVIDVSFNAAQSGMLQECIDTMKSKLDELPGAPRTQVGFITYDSAVHFYNLKATLKGPQMHVVADISELFIPIPDELLVNLSESRHVVDALLEMLPTMHQNTKNVETAMGPAIRAAFRVMANIGGKMLVFQAALPSLGQGVLKHRENNRLFGTDKEHTLLNSVDNFYRQCAIEFSRQQVSVDLFLFSHQYTDVATLGCLPKFSAGQLYYYPGFMASIHSAKFRHELGHCMTRATGWEAVMRVRCTQGMRLANFYGNSFMRGTDLLALPNVHEDSVFAIELCHADTLLTANVISVQAALLYTTSLGERRIRVHTMAIPVTKLFAEVFRAADVDALCNLLAKNSLEHAVKSGVDAARMRLQNKCVDIIRAYRTSGAYCGQQGSGYQLHLPESLQLLPLYTMAMIKNPVFRGGTDVRSDERTFLIYEMNNMSVEQSRVFIYPRLFAVHNMHEDCGTPIDKDGETVETEASATAGSKNICLPPVLNLSIERLSSDGAFLLEDSVTLYLWVGRAISPEFLSSVFNVNSLEGLDISQLKLAEPKDDISTRLNNVVNALREDRASHMQLCILREGDPMEGKLFCKLVEDRASFSGGSYSYSEYLGHVNRQSHAMGSN